MSSDLNASRSSQDRMPEKSKEDRLKETLRLLSELKRVGLSPVTVGYDKVKEILSKWVKDGEAVEAEVIFPRFDRVAKVSLPKMDDRAAGISLKVITGAYDV